jgi:DNA-binding CsgD family transcriptional regulator
MNPSDRQTTLYGREAECAHLQELLAKARGGESGTLVIRGDAGVGKSALLDFAAEQATGMQVLRIRATEAEIDLAFAGLFALLRPLVSRLDRLSDPQSRALAGAFGLAEAESPDRFLVSAGALGLLAAAAEDKPVCCLIDDAQWLDQPSADALVFAARRLGADAVALLFAASDWDGRHFDAPAIPELLVEGVEPTAAARILDEIAHDLSPIARERLLAEAAGNPLALRELPGGLTDAERMGRDPVPEHVALTPRLRGLFERRIQRLPTATREALLLCALDGTGSTAVVLQAAEQVELSVDSLAPAEASGLLRAERGRLSFTHPLARSAVIEAAPLAQRQRAHAALADALAGTEHVDRRVRHQAMAALTRDDDVADALEESALRAQERGGHAAAAIAFQRAAELTRDENRVAPRLVAAAEAAWNAGQTDHARALIGRGLGSARPGDLRAQLLHLRGLIAIAEGDYHEAAATLLAAAQESTDSSRKLAIFVDVVYTDIGASLPEELVIELSHQADAQPTPTPTDEFNKLVVLWLGRQMAREFDSAQAHYTEVVRLAAQLEDDPRAQYWAGLLTGFNFGNGDPAIPFSRRAVQTARAHGRIGLLPELLGALSLELALSSQFDSAYAAAAEGAQLARDLDQNPALNLLTLAWVEAIRGHEETARAHANEAGSHGFIDIQAAVGSVLGLLELGLGRPDAAAASMLDVIPPERLNMIAVMTIPDLIEALVRSGRAAEGGPLLERLRSGRIMAEPFRKSVLARCEALLETRPPAEAFEQALELADALPPFERARTELLFGEWLRRERQRKQARPHLRTAAEAFRRLGADPWTARAESELRATGETVRRRDPSTLAELTPQELQIAGLVAEGLTNREIAAQLFLSPRTIDYHLRKVFNKLGITARSELIRRAPLTGRAA